MTTIPHLLTRAYVAARPRTLFICATDRSHKHEVAERGELTGLRNVFWLPVKVKPCMDESAFFNDNLIEGFEFQLDIAARDFEDNFRPRFLSVFPDPQFGLSDWAGPMPTKTPKCYQLVKVFFALVQSPHEIDYRLPT